MEKDKIKQKYVGNNVRLSVNPDKKLVQFTDGIERVTLTYEEFEKAMVLFTKIK